MHEIAVWSDDYALLRHIEAIEHDYVTYGRLVLDDASSLENLKFQRSVAARRSAS